MKGRAAALQSTFHHSGNILRLHFGDERFDDSRFGGRNALRAKVRLEHGQFALHLRVEFERGLHLVHAASIPGNQEDSEP